ncbi:23S rRNA pseudouridine(2605) synthase RluB [Aliidiomarina iranensis]|uniref:Pseudouridine synthase n=1 Tax=Aliidiomarina iranensis TaxID=1434071 RepID=A0A432VSG4_9GAMM|nr:23S rRNA pseudouridine(2605) synthase RluB [Aliidiomarina iranensis]RUO19278.1 23S rRNA pseudouridine(2605) synthase RluB [Aliidiomarina iranensis]
MKDTEKLQKVLARSGHGSRRELETMISEGRIRVDGHVATLGERVTATADIRIDGHHVKVRNAEEQPCRVLVYHKPEGELVTRKDPEGRATVYERMPYVNAARWIAVGRLDINTSGLLLMTTDGELANRLMHPSYEVEREYAVRVFGEVGEAQIQRLLKGVKLEDGVSKFKKIKRRGGEGMNQWFHVILTEGKNREVRRLWESQGCTVSRLMRVRMGDLLLPKGLVQGGWMELQTEQVNYLRRLVELPLIESAPVITDEEQRRQLKQARRGSMRHRKENPVGRGGRRLSAGSDSISAREHSRNVKRSEERNEGTGQDGARQDRKPAARGKNHGKHQGKHSGKGQGKGRPQRQHQGQAQNTSGSGKK